jgi:hypothetical protein
VQKTSRAITKISRVRTSGDDSRQGLILTMINRAGRGNTRHSA